MNVFIGIFFCLCLLNNVLGQDSIKINCNSKKTLVIRKNNVSQIEEKDETKIISLSQKKITTNYSNTKGRNTKLNEEVIQEIPVKFPTLASGEFGLMNVQAYHEKMELKDSKYVILEYSVNQYGWAVEVSVIESNDLRLKDFVLRKLKASKWNSALNKKGERIKYKMYQQVVIVKDRLYEEDYTDDY